MFDTTPHWKALQRNWRMQCAASLLLPIALVWLLGGWQAAWAGGAIPLFILGLATLFLSVWRFRHYKFALIEAESLDDTPAAEQAWARLHHQQLLGLLNAKLPGWIGMLHYVATAEIVPLVLLVLTSQGVILLYRPPSAWVK
ncbi:MAG TPA: MFS transporter [Pseudomonas xinjiangensis]|uniref:MFS transporter n=2 Tax=root TaxID=1 RepID=A0A7V1FTD0_9GAMM|nr:MFS transporter [Halopseudomonas xinjiangensis]HEC48867.1 MFS transporter [Halopseudomonas xinjiangensis]